MSLSIFNTISTFTSMMCATMVLHINPQEETVLTRRPHGTCPWCCSLTYQGKDPFRILAYTGRGPDGVLIPLRSPRDAFREAGIDPGVQTKIYLHGFAERAPSISSLAVKDAYLSRGDYNILLVDWSHLSAAPWYVAAIRNTRIVGELLADFLLRTDAMGLLPLQGVHVIGFSLGAEAAGFMGKAMPKTYLSRGDYNILLVDWSHLSAAPWYVAAVRNTRIVGELLADFLLRTDAMGLLPLEGVHVIGFSLGAEAAGFMGKAMPKNRRVPRITGLDPAFPLYYGGRQFHLASGDAQFVDVIHTDAGILGYPTPIGDVDFYPNGGRTFQPGCLGRDIMTSLVSCSHLRAWRYYVESIKDPYGFPATKCERWKGILPPCRFHIDNYMGLLATPKNKGKFYLETNPEPPYAKDAPIEEKPHRYTLL